eukprot:scaffold51859_cov52-Attheya_sp.AAC.7
MENQGNRCVAGRIIGKMQCQLFYGHMGDDPSQSVVASLNTILLFIFLIENHTDQQHPLGQVHR